MIEFFKFKLGEILRDKITGFTGVVMGRTEYVTGCIQYGLLPCNLDKDGNMQSWKWLDEIRLKPTGERIEIQKDDSGPAPAAPEVN